MGPDTCPRSNLWQFPAHNPPTPQMALSLSLSSLSARRSHPSWLQHAHAHWARMPEPTSTHSRSPHLLAHAAAAASLDAAHDVLDALQQRVLVGLIWVVFRGDLQH